MLDVCSNNLTSSLCSGSSIIGCNYENFNEPIFTSVRDLAFIQCINSELLKRIAAQHILYYPISEQLTQQNFYNESKQKHFLNPIKLWSRIEWEEPSQTFNQFSMDEKSTITVYFDRYDLVKQNCNCSVGDFIKWNEMMFEIHSLTTWQPIHGMESQNLLMKATCRFSRQNQFNADQEDSEI